MPPSDAHRSPHCPRERVGSTTPQGLYKESTVTEHQIQQERAIRPSAIPPCGNPQEAFSCVFRLFYCYLMYLPCSVYRRQGCDGGAMRRDADRWRDPRRRDLQEILYINLALPTNWKRERERSESAIWSVFRTGLVREVHRPVLALKSAVAGGGIRSWGRQSRKHGR